MLQRVEKEDIPFNIAIVLASGGKVPVQFDTHEAALFASDGANELYRSKHVSGDIDDIANIEIVGIHFA